MEATEEADAAGAFMDADIALLETTPKGCIKPNAPCNYGKGTRFCCDTKNKNNTLNEYIGQTIGAKWWRTQGGATEEEASALNTEYQEDKCRKALSHIPEGSKIAMLPPTPDEANIWPRLLAKKRAELTPKKKKNVWTPGQNLSDGFYNVIGRRFAKSPLPGK